MNEGFQGGNTPTFCNFMKTSRYVSNGHFPGVSNLPNPNLAKIAVDMLEIMINAYGIDFSFSFSIFYCSKHTKT